MSDHHRPEPKTRVGRLVADVLDRAIDRLAEISVKVKATTAALDAQRAAINETRDCPGEDT